MSKKIKLLVEVDEEIFEHLKAKELLLFMVDDICRAVENGTPITEGDMISRSELQERREADRWRPISEPPKEHDYYLVTCEFEVARGTDIALFYPDRKGEEQWSLNYVIAWKPLPEPYKENDK